MAIENNGKNKAYIKTLFKFYFDIRPIWRSFLTIFYLVFFSYFAFFYSGKLWIALKFIIYTVTNSVSFLTLNYLFWGVIFLITLIVPFSISFYAIFLLFETWQHNDGWTKWRKILFTFLIFLAVPLIIYLMDKSIRVVIEQDILKPFVKLYY